MNYDFFPPIVGWFIEISNSLLGKSFPLPFGQTIIVLILATICLVWGKFKWGFLISYIFIIYWTMAANKVFFMTLSAGNPIALVIYVFSGLLVTLLILYGFFQESH